VGRRNKHHLPCLLGTLDMLKVGLTGGIGCGKSTVCSIFARLGTPIIDTDILAREAVSKGSTTLEKLVSTIDESILLPDGNLDRSKLREIVFSDPDIRIKVESIIHPEIRSLLVQRLGMLTTPYVVIAIPLLIEKKWNEYVDRVLVVDCSIESQINRTRIRDGNSKESIQRIIDAQVSRDKRLHFADDIIYNDSDISELQMQVDKLHLYYTQMSQ
jgi:dephospho-CoA kinase